VEGARLSVSPRLAALMSYPKFASSTPRMLILQSDYWLDGACGRAAEGLGWEVRRAPVTLEGVMSREMIGGLLETLALFRPDFIFSVNASGMDEMGILARLFADLHVPSVTWYVDVPRTILLDRDCYGSEYALGLTWDGVYEDYLRSVGYAEAHTLPLGVDDSLFNAPPAEAWDRPPTFIANSMTANAAREWAWLAARAPVALAVSEAFVAGRVSRDTFGAGLDAMMGEGVAAEWDEHERRHAEMYCFIEGTRRLRMQLVETLDPLGMAVAGDDDWRAVSSQCLPYINYSLELPEYYRRCPVNVNSTSLQMPQAVNQRVLDCPAAGGFLLTDAQSQLGELFDLDKEAAVYHSLDEARAMYTYFLREPAARTRIAGLARRRALGEHTYGHRLLHIVSLLKSRFGKG
jgi:spore maturation protein CgeB